jgi:D-glycero-D-manno-heptose 1,7-bisphosphate phosphatase
MNRQMSAIAPRPAVFLDRDGVIIENRTAHVRTWGDVAFFEESISALKRLSDLPVAVVVVSNQGAVGRKMMTLEQAWDIQKRIVEIVHQRGGRVDASYLCPHHPKDGCDCRKPSPGMILQAAKDLNLDLSRSWLVGDAVTDLEAARAAKVRNIMIRTGRGRDQEALLPADWKAEAIVVDDLAAAVDRILETDYSSQHHQKA